MGENKVGLIIVAAVVVAAIVGGGVWVANSMNNQETTNTEEENTQMTDNNQATQEQQNIVQIASATEDLSTLVAAVSAAGLVETLQGAGPFTVFAPNNAAFAALPAGTVDTLLKPENKDQLTSILTYHVVAAKAMSSDLTDGQTIATVQGQNLTVNIDGSKVQITDAAGNSVNVIMADVEASNGVVHVIDGVLMPQSN